MRVELLSLSIISLIFTTLLLGFVLAVVVISYRRILDKLHELRLKEIEMKEKVSKDAQSIIDEARKRAVEIISTANIFTEDQNKTIQQQLNKFSELQATHYDKALDEIKEHTINLVESIAADIKKNTLSDFDKLLLNMQTELQKSRDGLQNSLSEAYKKDYEEAKKQIDEYKQARIKRIDESVDEILKDFSVKVFGKILSFSEHEDLIIQSLEEAKRKHVL